MSSDDTTKQLPTEDRLEALITLVQRVVADVGELKAEQEDLKKKLEERQLETKPIWEKALQEILETRTEMRERFDKVDGEIRDMNRRIRTLIENTFELQNNQRVIDERVDNLEKKVS